MTIELSAFHRYGASASRSSYISYASRAAFSVPRTASKFARHSN